MKLIFDENVPLPLRQFFAAHEVTTVQAEGWAGARAGRLRLSGKGAGNGRASATRFSFSSIW